jgi:hypothetical protein
MNTELPSHQIVEELCADAGGVRKFREKVLGTGIVTKLDTPVLESWTREPKDFTSINPLEKTARLIAAAKDVLPLQWLCGRLGGFFVPGPEKFSPVLGKGAQTWFVASLQLHDLRRVVIEAFQDGPKERPSITEVEARLIARSWATVFGWIEGFLQVHEPAASRARNSADTQPVLPVLFRSTASWQALDHVFRGNLCPSRNAVSEAVAKPFGDGRTIPGGSTRFPHKDTLDKWSQPPPSASRPGKGCANPLDYALALSVASDPAIPLKWLSGNAGGTFARPENRAVRGEAHDDLLRSWERTMVELAELDSSIARALLDRKIDPHERVRLRKDWSDVHSWMKAFVIDW